MRIVRFPGALVSDPLPLLNPLKFNHPIRTLTGDERAFVPFNGFETLWFNTGTLCNLSCANCYIESSPTNDALVFISTVELNGYLDELETMSQKPKEIGFTGGEPFINPEMNTMLETCLNRGYRTLVLTNAMRPMQRLSVLSGLSALNGRFPGQIIMRVSLDHYTAELHEQERGSRTWQPTIDGTKWLVDQGFTVHVAGRSCWGETVEDARRGYDRLFQLHDWPINAMDPAQLVIFPEMGTGTDLPEITTDCWRILNKSPDQMMCATSRMVIKRKGDQKPTVVACTLLPYTAEFDYGSSLASSMVDTHLNHPHCARFCVLGGASCSG